MTSVQDLPGGDARRAGLGRACGTPGELTVRVNYRPSLATGRRRKKLQTPMKNDDWLASAA